jgi:hypothetical protein
LGVFFWGNFDVPKNNIICAQAAQFFGKKKVQNPKNRQFFDLRNLKPTVNIPKPGIFKILRTSK